MKKQKKRVVYDGYLDDADSAMLFGAQGTGKGYRTKQLCSIETRLIVWDSMQNWDKKKDALTHVIYGDLKALQRVIRNSPRFRISFIPDLSKIKEQFSMVCKLVFAHGRMCFMADELDEVTTASHAPAAWRSLTGRGRHRGIRLRGNGQRPAEVDKRAITNATQVMVGRLTEQSDLKALRSKFGDNVNLLPGFPDGKQLLWLAGVGVYLVEKNGKRKKLQICYQKEMEAMHTLSIDDKSYNLIKEMAASGNKSEAAVIHDAINKQLELEKREQSKRHI